MIQLFAYGTLRDPEFQEALFGTVIAMRPATLHGWMPVVAESGYLTIVAAPGDRVAGDLLALDASALAIADDWEDVPLYIRTHVEVTPEDGAPVSAWVYVRPTASRTRAPEDILTTNDRAHVIAQIRASRR